MGCFWSKARWEIPETVEDVMVTKVRPPLAPAINLDDAYLAFDPLRPLSGSELELYCMGREPNSADRIRQILLTALDYPDKILPTGHWGCGKSTELNRLLADPQIQQTFLIVPFPLANVLDPLDLEYVDLLVAIEASLYRAARDAEVQMDEKLAILLERFWLPQSEPVGFLPSERASPARSFSGWFVLPNIKVRNRNGSPNEEALDLMSGGVMREMTTLMQLACNEAQVAGKRCPLLKSLLL